MTTARAPMHATPAAPQAPTRSDVLILGGGLMGCCTAFFLRQRHGLSVTLLERELVGRQASGTNFGNVRRQGRYCGQAGAEIVAACAGLPLQAVGRLRAQAPVKPLLMDTPEATP